MAGIPLAWCEETVKAQLPLGHNTLTRRMVGVSHGGNEHPEISINSFYWSEPHWLDSHWAEIRMPSGVVE